MAEKKYLQLNDLSAYKMAFALSNLVWDIVISWDYFAKDTVGKQFVRATDSISANIAEGFGRKGKRDKIKFYYYAAASAKEALDWNEKARIRELMNKEQYEMIFKQLEQLPKEINSLIKFTYEKLKY